MTMVATAKRIIANENGFVLGASILISAILLLAGVLALWTSNTEMHIVRNEGDLTLEFYNAEGAVIDAMENYDTGPTTSPGQVGATNWLTDQFLFESPGGAAAKHFFKSVDANGQSVAEVRVRCISMDKDPGDLDGDGNYNEPLPIAFGPGVNPTAADESANNLPLQQHIAPPPSGSGFSLKYFEVRRYGITATSSTGNTRTQIGTYKVFNKY